MIVPDRRFTKMGNERDLRPLADTRAAAFRRVIRAR